MGRITIFSIEECNYCRQTKAALSSRNIPYIEINIESYPAKRADMISLADRMSVPQVFFNDEHIGGSVETLEVLSKWDEEIAKEGCEDNTPYVRYVRLIESKPDPTDERLAVPTDPLTESKKVDFTVSRSSEAYQLDDKQYTTLDFTKLLVQKMPRESLTYWGCLYYNVFRGSSGVTALQEMFKLESREEAVQLGLKLQRKHCISHVCKDHPFGDNGFYYRLQPFQSPHVLNSFRIWCDNVKDKPMFVIHRLGKMWSKLESKHLTDDGLIDNATIRSDDLYWKFEEEICELQRICLKDMDERTRLAFVINVYNLCIKYAFVKVGVPDSTVNRSSFFGDVSVNIGGCVFSFDDLEHGILRANSRHPYQLTRRFGVMDGRKRLATKDLDPRVHFALNCGARSCPPIMKYTSEAIEEELRLAAMAFCEEDSNVEIDEENNQLKLSKILYWYQSDFVKSKEELPQKVAEYLRGEKKEKLDKLIQEGNISIKFNEYDWSTNNVNSLTYAKGDLSDKCVFPYSQNPPPQKYDQVQD